EAEQYEDPSDKTESESPIVELLKELQPRKIAIPFANELSARYPTRNLVARRDFRKLMNLIGVSAYLHQQQRLHAKKGTDLVIVADSKDFQNVSKIARGALQESLHGMSEKEQELLEAVKGGLVIVSELVNHLR